ncbi:hypothetical protein ZWY2020_045538 [Hordeum vulgare]|nr:hypothetical protein ZWY2020_045538 [Hordeum vulgare]
MGNTIGRVEAADPTGSGVMEAADPIGVRTGEMEEADPVGAWVVTGVKQISVDQDQEKPLAITADQLKALEEASLELGLIKLQDASDFFSAAARFAAARRISYLPEPKPFFPKIFDYRDLRGGMHRMSPSPIARQAARGVYRGTVAQRRALDEATKRHLRMDSRSLDSKALEVYKELKKTAVRGDKLLSPHDVARVLKAEASVSDLHPTDRKFLQLLKIFTENINGVAAVITATGISAGAAKGTLHHWNTSFPMTDLPEDFFW